MDDHRLIIKKINKSIKINYYIFPLFLGFIKAKIKELKIPRQTEGIILNKITSLKEKFKILNKFQIINQKDSMSVRLILKLCEWLDI